MIKRRLEIFIGIPHSTNSFYVSYVLINLVEANDQVNQLEFELKNELIS